DPWTGFNGSLSTAFRVAGTKSITTYTWNVTSGSWTVAANWTPQRTAPATDDILVFDGAVTSSMTATDVPNQTMGQLRVVDGAQTTLTSPFGTVVTLSVGGGTGDDIVVSAGSKLALATGGNFGNIHLTLLIGTTGSCSGELTVAGAAHRILPTDAGSLVFESGSNCRTLAGFIGRIFDD